MFSQLFPHTFPQKKNESVEKFLVSHKPIYKMFAKTNVSTVKEMGLAPFFSIGKTYR